MSELTSGMRKALTIMADRERATGRKWGPIQDVDKRSLYGMESRGLAVRNGYQGVAKLTDEGFRMAESLNPKNDDGAASPPADPAATPAPTGGGETGGETPTAAESATAKAAPSSPTWYCAGCSRKQRPGSYPCSLCCGYTGKRANVVTNVLNAFGHPSSRVPS